MLSMTRRGVWSVLCLAVSLSASCGDSAKPKADDTPNDDADAGKVEKDSGTSNGGNTGDDNNGKDNGGTTGSTRIAITDAPNCAGDDPTTPGSECDDVVTCGGSQDDPHACPLDTHTCCVSGPPAETTVNCYEGKAACKGIESTTPCDGSEDCGQGSICCVTPPGAVVITECRAFADCDEPSEGTIFCHSDADCPEGKACSSPETATWWGFCN